MHGGNRLASNSLLECVVCAYEVANFLKNKELKTPKQIDEDLKAIVDKYSKELLMEELDVEALKKELQGIMWKGAGILRDERSLMTALEEIQKLSKKFPRSVKCLSKEEYEFKNMLIVSKLIIQSALQRKESRGAHYRLDYLNTNEKSKHSLLTKEEGELSFVK